MDSTTPSPERIELIILKKSEDGDDDAVSYTTVDEDTVKKVIDEIQKEVEAEQKKAEASTGDI
jgi:hypothetical protein